MKLITRLTLVPALILLVFTTKGQTADLPGVSPETVADYIHAVIEAHRAVYTAQVVDRLHEQGGPKADGEWRAHKMSLPLPVQLVTETSNMFFTKATGLRYRLISLWPINPQNSPRDQGERTSLQTVGERPERPATRTVTVEDRTYFRAIYADIAVSQACIDCHNTHPKSPKKDFQMGDVIGGLVIEFPLENR